MKQINTNQHSFLQLGVALALILCRRSCPWPAEAGFHAPRIADWLPDDETFMVESETNRRIFGVRIGYKPLHLKEPFCKSKVYGSFIGNVAKIYNNRKCDNKNLCHRPSK
ncbi:hypothetical protein CDL12_00053 [Handroanthus impetiginosus]|uniref:Uncharacterized protein n=1 Tax=Handroanthus impetiginosus TaxID=429701 RepID=A0A2G9IBR5_9LAMI|nr:hypothetical protein CDL12_00053 [Handroanthus impetiginosus]